MTSSTSSATAANTSADDAPRATSVATRRNAACSSARGTRPGTGASYRSVVMLREENLWLAARSLFERRRRVRPHLQDHRDNWLVELRLGGGDSRSCGEGRRDRTQPRLV